MSLCPSLPPSLVVAVRAGVTAQQCMPGCPSRPPSAHALRPGLCQRPGRQRLLQGVPYQQQPRMQRRPARMYMQRRPVHMYLLRRPAHMQLRPAHMQRRPAHMYMQLRPAHVQLRPTHMYMQRRPARKQLRPAHVQLRPAHMQLRPAHALRQTPHPRRHMGHLGCGVGGDGPADAQPFCASCSWTLPGQLSANSARLPAPTPSVARLLIQPRVSWGSWGTRCELHIRYACVCVCFIFRFFVLTPSAS